LQELQDQTAAGNKGEQGVIVYPTFVRYMSTDKKSMTRSGSIQKRARRKQRNDVET
jgi:hypothetical protein